MAKTTTKTTASKKTPAKRIAVATKPATKGNKTRARAATSLNRTHFRLLGIATKVSALAVKSAAVMKARGDHDVPPDLLALSKSISDLAKPAAAIVKAKR